ncbi:hypothetical protein [Massilia sp.]|uniref:hypothetical protein n=1 Tax=Massilia sp. TaxID=1882437 RepID=UPI00391C0663
MRPPAILTLLIGAAILFGCKQPATEAAAPEARAAAAQVKAYPVESQLDKFEIRPNECAGEIEKLARDRSNLDAFKSSQLYYDYAGDPATGGAALDMSSKNLTEEASWHQSLDVNDDGLCDYLATTFSGRSSWGQGFGISLRKTPGTSLEKAFGPLPGESDSAEDKQKYFADGASLPPRLGGPMPLPGTEYDKTIVYRIHPKDGGTPYIVVPSYDYTSGMTAMTGPDLMLDERDAKEGGGYEYRSYPASGLLLWVFRWDPKIGKFKDLSAGWTAGDAFLEENRKWIFGPDTAEYWSVRAYIAERHLMDALKAFKAHDYTRASLLMGYANAADPRNPDIWGWRGALEYAGGRFKDAARYYAQAIAWTDVRRLPVAPILYFNRGLALEAVCWNKVQDRREGEKPGCDEDTHQSAVAAYEAYLKAAPQGERAAEARARLADMARGVYREPRVDPDMPQASAAIDRMTKAFAQARREIWQQAQAKEEAQRAQQEAKPKPTALDPETGQPVGAPTRDVFKLSPADLKTIDAEINRLLKQKGKTFVQSRIDWMIAYKAKFPAADLADMIDRPEHYEALPWVQKWRQTYNELPR